MKNSIDHDNIPDTLRVRVTPKARSERIKTETAADGSILYKVYVTAVPENGKANEAVIKLLAKTLCVPKTSLKITHGFTNRDKVIKVTL